MDKEVRLQHGQQQELVQEQHLACTVLAMLSISFWIVIWVMHMCALTNARIKFRSTKSNKQEQEQQEDESRSESTTLKQQQQQPQNKNLQHYFSNPHHHLFTCEQERQKLAAPITGAHHHQDQISGIAGAICNNGSSNNNPSCPLSPRTATTISLDKNPPIESGGRSHHPDDRAQVRETLVTSLAADDESAAFGRLHLDASNLNNDLISLSSGATGAIGAIGAIDGKQGSRLPHYFKENLNSGSNNNPNPTSTTTTHINHHSKYISLPLPGVSIIKPLVGVDKNLFHNLETFFHLEYPTYELLFCVQDSRDPAILVVQELFRKYPKADARLFIGGSRVGVNPKINNMQPAYEHMKYELVLISDSGISIRPDTLGDMVGHMADNVALVHQMPFVYTRHGRRDNFQSIVELVYFGTAHARAYLTADLLNINCPTGMSALMRKCLLDEVGGIKAFSQYLAEDFFFAKSFTERGWKLRISSQPALQNSANSSDSLQTFNSRIQRWIKLRFAMVPVITLLEPFSECMLLGLMGALATSFLWALNPFLVFAAHVALWFALDYQLLCTIQNGPPTCRRLHYLAAWLIRELTAPVVFLKAVTDPKVNWRSREFKIKWGGFTEEISAPASASAPAPAPAEININNKHQRVCELFLLSPSLD